MEKKTKSVIISLKEGFTKDDVLPIVPMGDTQDQTIISFENTMDLQPIFNKYSSKKSLFQGGGDMVLSNNASTNLAYNQMNEAEKNITRLFTIHLGDDDNADQLIEFWNNHEGIEFLEGNSIEDEPLTVNVSNNITDTHYRSLYALDMIKCDKVWQESKGKDIKVAVIDSGIDYNHADIKGNLWSNSNGEYGYNYSANNTEVFDNINHRGGSHGTHVSGIIAAQENGIGVIGVAPEAELVALKIFPSAYPSKIAKAITDTADKYDAIVMNNSWGPSSRRPEKRTYETAFMYAVSMGVIPIVAAGNENDDVKYYAPANSKYVITVGSVNENGIKADSSNYGEGVDIWAPGVSILSLKSSSNSNYVYKSGTSMAAPHVAGVVALLKSSFPSMSFDDVLNTLQTTGDPLSDGRPGKIINALAAFDFAKKHFGTNS